MKPKTLFTLITFVWLIATVANATTNINQMPKDFVLLKNIDPSIKQEIKYYGTDNFIGRRVAGYEQPVCLVTKPAAIALKKIQAQLKKQQLALLVFDCYRPRRAVEDFKQWSKDVADQKTKPFYYPKENKKDFFKRGYVAEFSGHSRGSTVDLTIVDLQTGKQLDMGTPFDFLDVKSHADNREISAAQQYNRRLLRDMMRAHGFEGITTEWWHFTLKKEPYSNIYFDFPVKH